MEVYVFIVRNLSFWQISMMPRQYSRLIKLPHRSYGIICWSSKKGDIMLAEGMVLFGR